MKNKEKELNKERLDEAVALILKYKAELSSDQLRVLSFSLYVEEMERSDESKRNFAR